MKKDTCVPWLNKGRSRFVVRHCENIDVDFVKAMNPTVFIGSLKHTNIHNPWSGEAPLDVVEKGIDQELIDQIRDLQQSGIRVMTYIAAHQIDRTMFSKEDVEKLAARDEEGELSIAFATRHYNDVVRTCYNNPYWLEHMSKLQMLHMKKAGVDGMWIDISDIFVDCRCAYCRKNFREEYGYDISEAATRAESKSSLFNIAEDMVTADAYLQKEMRRHYESWAADETSGGGDAMVSVSSPIEKTDAEPGNGNSEPITDTAESPNGPIKKHKDLVDFRVKCYDSFFAEVRRRVEEEVGKTPPYVCNGYGLHRDGIVLETGFTYAPHENMYFFRWGNLLTKGTCLVTTRTMDGVPSVSQFKIASGEGAAFDGYFMHWGHTLYNSNDLRKAQREFHDFMARYEDVYAEQKDVSKVGVLVSLFSDQITGGTNYSRSKGFCQALSDMHVPHDFVLADSKLTAEKLSRHKLMILPDVQVIGDNDFFAVQEFLRSSGRIITTGQNGIFDEHVDRRKEKLEGEVVFFEGQPELDFLGERLVGPDWGIFFREAGEELKKNIEKTMGQRAIVTDAQVSVKFGLAETPQALLLHMVNYECGMRLIRQNLFPKERIKVRVRSQCPIRKVTLVSPDIEGYEQGLEYKQDGECVELVVPELVHYNMIMMEK